jgi:hypothetical protein
MVGTVSINQYAAISRVLYSGGDVGRYPGVTNSCVARFVDSGKEPRIVELIGNL